jgi:predicted anti-sigma-YlaC factor YlaD
MECARARETISAALDGEGSATELRRVEAHLRRCEACRTFHAHAVELQGTLRDARTPVPDLTAHIVDGVARHREWRVEPWVRVALLTLGLAQLLLAIPDLLGSDEGAPIHIAHEVGSWDVALAIGFIFVAWRPLRAVGMLPFVAALSFMLVLTAAIDLLHGHADAIFETTHLLEVVGSLLLWYLAHPIALPRPRVRVLD